MIMKSDSGHYENDMNLRKPNHESSDYYTSLQNEEGDVLRLRILVLPILIAITMLSVRTLALASTFNTSLLVCINFPGIVYASSKLLSYYGR